MKKVVLLCFLLVGLSISCVFLRPPGKCKVDTMLLNKDDFPTDTIVGQIETSIAEMPEESAGVDARYDSSLMYQEIARYPTNAIAEKEFEEAKKRASSQTQDEGPWETPPELSHASTIFQRYYVSCGKTFIGKYQCRMIGQYDEYYVFFFAYITDKGVTFDILNGLLKKIDLRMEQCLQG